MMSNEQKYENSTQSESTEKEGLRLWIEEHPVCEKCHSAAYEINIEDRRGLVLETLLETALDFQFQVLLPANSTLVSQKSQQIFSNKEMKFPGFSFSPSNTGCQGCFYFFVLTDISWLVTNSS